VNIDFTPPHPLIADSKLLFRLIKLHSLLLSTSRLEIYSFCLI
jgi:hypothetical protein